MILDHLDNASRYFPLHPGFRPAFEYVRRTNLAGLADGRCDIDGGRLYLIMAHSACRNRDAAVLEAHRKYIDIQIPLDVPEEMGWSPVSLCGQVTVPYDEARDVAFLGDRPRSWVTVNPGDFVVFFPHDTHAPLVSVGSVHKAVLKVAVNW